MYKSKAKLIATAFIIFVISFFYMNSNFATNQNKNNNEVTDWKVEITSDTKDLKDTQEISFKPENNSNVAEGKIAPGVKVVSTIEVNLIGTKVPVDIQLKIDDTNLLKQFKLAIKLNDEIYIPGSIKKFELPPEKVFTEENGKKIFKIELEWQDDNDNEIDTALGIIGGTIKLPVTINVKQHI